MSLLAAFPGSQATRGLLAQVLDNLVSNAVKFTPAGGTVWVRAASEDDGVALMVQDTGPGIPPDEVPKVFDRFFRASTAGEAPGTGLGLSIVKAIVEAHEGVIAVESELGVGTTFRCVLPLDGAGAKRRAGPR